MNRIYSWAMRNSAPILFAVAALIFCSEVGQGLIGFKSTMVGGYFAGQPVSRAALQWAVLLTRTFTAAGSAALPFTAAAVLYRWDQYLIRTESKSDLSR